MGMKQNTDAEKSTKFVTSAVHTHGAMLEQRLQNMLAPYLDPGENLTILPMVRAIARRMEDLLLKSTEAAAEHEKELANDSKEREEATSALTQLYDYVVLARKIVDTNLEPGAAIVLQATGTTPRTTFPLLTFARNFGNALCNPAIVVATREGVTVDRVHLGNKLLQLANILETEQHEVTEEVRKAEQTQMAKWDSAQAQVAAFTHGTGSISALFRLAGFAYLAERLRPPERGSALDTETPLPPPEPASNDSGPPTII